MSGIELMEIGRPDLRLRLPAEMWERLDAVLAALAAHYDGLCEENDPRLGLMPALARGRVEALEWAMRPWPHDSAARDMDADTWDGIRLAVEEAAARWEEVAEHDCSTPALTCEQVAELDAALDGAARDLRAAQAAEEEEGGE